MKLKSGILSRHNPSRISGTSVGVCSYVQLNEQYDMTKFEAAAKWWALNIQSPNTDNGDNSPNGAVASALLNSLVREVAPEQLEAFESTMVATLERYKEGGHGYINISCDYDPCPILREALDTAGIGRRNAPIKTSMDIEDDEKIYVSAGYCARSTQIYPET